MIQYFPFNEPTIVEVSYDTSKGETICYELVLGYWLDPSDPSDFPRYCSTVGRYYDGTAQIPSEIAIQDLVDAKIALQRKDSPSKPITLEELSES